MSLIINRRPGESFVLIDRNDPASFVMVTITKDRRIAIAAPQNVHVLRREIIHRYNVDKRVLDGIAEIESKAPATRHTTPGSL